MKKIMTHEERMKAVDEFFKNKSQRDCIEMLYNGPIERMEAFDRKLWEEVIDNQIEVGDEDAWYSKDPKIHKFKDLWHCFNPYVDERLPWVDVEDADFPTRFLLLEHNGKQLITSLMIGQGAACDTCTVEGFKKWMKRNKWTAKIPKKGTTLDELALAMKDTVREMKEAIRNADTRKGR